MPKCFSSTDCSIKDSSMFEYQIEHLNYTKYDPITKGGVIPVLGGG